MANSFKTKGSYFTVRIAKIRKDYDPSQHASELMLLILPKDVFIYPDGSYIGNDDPKSSSGTLQIFGFDKPEDAYVYRLSQHNKDGVAHVDAKYLRGDSEDGDIFIHAISSLAEYLNISEEFAVAISRILRSAWEFNCDEDSVTEVANDLENVAFEGAFSGAFSIKPGLSEYAGGVFVEVTFAEDAPAKISDAGTIDFGRVELDKYVNTKAGFVFIVS